MNDYVKASQMLAEVLMINDRYLPALLVLPELLLRIGSDRRCGRSAESGNSAAAASARIMGGSRHRDAGKGRYRTRQDYSITKR